jgi:hypothetical protein
MADVEKTELEDTATPKAPEKRKTVHVRNVTGRPLMLHLHETIPDDGGGRSFQGRLLSSTDPGIPDAVSLRGGANPGIDKEFFDKWREQNKGTTLKDLLFAEDEDEPESAKREEHD